MRPREEPAYAGALAATRRDVAFVSNPDGSSRKVELVVSVNAGTDPLLAEAARHGTLHHIDDLDLAVPFAYHDPVAKRFALVIPTARAHEELPLRIELLRKLSEERAPIPAYVREARAVIGPKGLERLLSEPDTKALAAREAHIATREERLHARAEDVTRREDDIQLQLEQIAVERGQLETRAEELAVREVAIAAREQEFTAARARFDAERSQRSQEDVAQRERKPSGGAPSAARLPSTPKSAAKPSTLAASQSAAETSQPIELLPKRAPSALDSVEEAEPLESEAANAAEAIEEAEPVAEPIEEAEPIDGEPAQDAIAEAEPLDEPEETAAEANAGGEVDELDPIEPETTPADEDLLAAVPTAERGAPKKETPSVLSGDRDARAAVVDGEVRMWLRGSGDTVTALAASEAVPVLQADPSSTLPLALLSVVSDDGATRFGRAALDLTAAEDRAVIDALARDFHVRVEVVSRDGRSLDGHAVSARGGEEHAKHVGKVLAARPSSDALARRVEADRIAREGIAYDGGVNEASERALFDEQQLATAQGVARALAVIEAVNDPAAKERWQLARGVPAARLEATEKRALFAMLRVGIKPSPVVVKSALSLSVASDEKALAAKALASFARTCDAGAHTVGLDPKSAYESLGNLISWAHASGVSPIPNSALDALSKLYDPEAMDSEFDDPRPFPSEAEMAAMDAAELARWCAHPKARAMAALRLAKKDARGHGATLARALKSMDAPSAAPVLAAMVPSGDELADTWVELASSKKPVAAAAGAVAIAKIKLRRGLMSVLQRALTAGTTESQLFGWAAGEFGAGAVRAMTASMVEGEAVERGAWVLAHVVRAGGGREVERIRTGSEDALSQAATQGVGAVDDARDYDKSLREGKGLTPGERAASAFLSVL
ncbi:MAG: hypothetical protein U0269_27010 [Polyangiales bacterium]